MARPLFEVSFVLTTFLSSICHQAPAAFSRQYEIGSVYYYNYETSVLLNEPQLLPVSSPKDVGFRLGLNVELAPLWQHPERVKEQLVQLKVSFPKLSVKARQGPTPDGFVDKPSKIDGYSLQPFFFHWVDGVISKVYYVEGEELSLVNIKKETDTSGSCDVSYVLGDHFHIAKVKNNCQPVNVNTFYNHTSPILGANIKSQASTSYEVEGENKIIKTASGVETHFLRMEAKQQSGVEVMSRQDLNLQSKDQDSSFQVLKSTSIEEALESLKRSFGKALVEDTLATKPEEKECIACKSLKDLVDNFRNALKSNNLARQSSSIAFLRILGKIRQSDSETIKKILTSKKNAEILPQLLDIVAATQTEDSHKAALAVINLNGGKVELTERYLLSVSLSTHPSEFLIQDLMPFVRKGLSNFKLYETLVLTVTSLTNTFSKLPQNKDKKIISEVCQMVLSKLDACTDEPCQLIYIRALKNLRNVETMQALLRFAEATARKPAIYAMRAIQTMPLEYFNNQTVKRLERIFLQLDCIHDTSVRAMAADVIFQVDPSEEFLRLMLGMLGRQEKKELNTLLLCRLNDLADNNEKTRKILKKLLSDPQLANYHIHGQNGLSSAFSRFIMENQSANSSFSNMLEINGGLLKRTTIDVYLDNPDNRMRILSFGIFAGGLSMFGSEGSEDDGEDANAGIEITLMDTQLRPFIFFEGQGELMGHVWAGTASERTTALQGSLLLQDHHQVVPLQNGFSSDLILTGVLSYDFAGEIQISLWNRNAHSLVEVGAAMVVQGQARVDTSFVQTLIEFNNGMQAQLNFISDLDFYDKIIMCLQMVQPNFDAIENVRKLERIPGSNYVLRKYKRKSSPVPGKTYIMNKKNTELCNEMFNKN